MSTICCGGRACRCEEAANVIAAPFWSTIRAQSRDRGANGSPICARCFPVLLITGPFSILLGFDGGLMALNDRLKLRSMVAAEKGDRVYHCQRGGRHPRAWSRTLSNVWAPTGGEPVIVTRKGGAILMAIGLCLPDV